MDKSTEGRRILSIAINYPSPLAPVPEPPPVFSDARLHTTSIMLASRHATRSYAEVSHDKEKEIFYGHKYIQYFIKLTLPFLASLAEMQSTQFEDAGLWSTLLSVLYKPLNSSYGTGT